MQNREQWGSKLGFILAASGSAVGIGNIWKFPYIAGENGGAAFTLVYLLCILVVGFTIVVAEFAIGRSTQLSPVGAFEKLAPNSNWKWVGFLGVASAFVILSFYGVVGGWILKYTLISISGGFESLSGDVVSAQNIFTTFIASTWSPILFQVIFMVLCVYVIVNGVKDGIETWSKIMMPIIIVLLFVLAIRGLTLPGGLNGLKFLFLPRFNELTASAIVLALGHSFFTLSLGMGTMITYGSYLNREQNLLKSALWVIALDTAIAMLAGVAIFTTVFALGADPAGGPGLIFFILPSVFPQVAYGALWGTLFFSLLFMAALTSAISILEVVTAYFIDQKGWSRKKATIQFGSVITIVGVFCSLSMGGGINIAEYFGSSFQHYLGQTFFDVMDNLSSKYMLPFGGMMTAIFILIKWGVPSFVSELGTIIPARQSVFTSLQIGIFTLVLSLIGVFLPWYNIGDQGISLLSIMVNTENTDWIGVLALIIGSVILILDDDKRIVAACSVLGISIPLYRFYKINTVGIDLGAFQPSFGIGGYLILFGAILQLSKCFFKQKVWEENLNRDRLIVTILCLIAASIAGFILLNELIKTVTGNAIIG